MKSPLHKISKKNRNIISGILVSIAAVYAVASFLNVPQSQINSFFFTTLLFMVGIITLAIITVIVFKALLKLKGLLFKP